MAKKREFWFNVVMVTIGVGCIAAALTLRACDGPATIRTHETITEQDPEAMTLRRSWMCGEDEMIVETTKGVTPPGEDAVSATESWADFKQRHADRVAKAMQECPENQ